MANEEKILEMLGTINDRLGRLETAQDKMQATQVQMNDRLGRLETAQDKMQATQAQMNDRLGRLETAQDKMQQDLTGVKAHLEVDVDRGIKLLAEGHAGIVEKLKKLDEIEEKLEETSVKVDAIHAVVKEHGREITELKRVR